MESGTQVCDLRLYAFIRFVFGYHTGTQLRKWDVLSKLYSVFIVTLVVCFACCAWDSSVLTISACIEYIIYTFISLKYRDQHVYRFYQRRVSIDMLPLAEDAYGRLWMCQLSAIVVLSGLRLFCFTLFCYNFISNYSSIKRIGFFFLNVLLLALDVSQIGYVIIFYLLYLRVKLIKKTMKANGFATTPLLKYSAQKYVQMYEDLIDALYENEFLLKFTMSIFLCFSTPRLINVIFFVLSYMKTTGFIDLLAVLLVMNGVLPYTCFLCGVVLLDLAHDEANAIKMMTLAKYVKDRNERTRCALGALLTALEQGGSRVTLWRAVPLALRTPLTTGSFLIVSTMGIVQIKLNF